MAKPTFGSRQAQPALVVFGQDKAKKLRAGWFGPDQAELAAKAAAAVGLSVWKLESDADRRLAAKIKAGNVHGAGDRLLPIIGRKIFAEIAAAAASSAPSVKNGKKSATAEIVYRGIPSSFDEIEAGHLVIAQDSPKDGWYEAIVLARSGDRFTVRWRDYPKYAPFDRSLISIALPPPSPSSDPVKS